MLNEKNIMETQIVDNYKEHEFHLDFDQQCSTCFSEQRKLRLELAEIIGRVPKDYKGRLCWNEDGNCDDERCYCYD